MKRLVNIMAIVLCMLVLLTGCGSKDAGQKDNMTSTSGEAGTDNLDGTTREDFDSLAAENKELWNQVILLQNQQYKSLEKGVEDISLDYYANNAKRHQEMSQALMVIQDIVQERKDYSDVLVNYASGDILSEVEMADFEDVSDTDIPEAVAEIRQQNEALKSRIKAMSPEMD